MSCTPPFGLYDCFHKQFAQTYFRRYRRLLSNLSLIRIYFLLWNYRFLSAYQRSAAMVLIIVLAMSMCFIRILILNSISIHSNMDMKIFYENKIFENFIKFFCHKVWPEYFVTKLMTNIWHSEWSMHKHLGQLSELTYSEQNVLNFELSFF